MREKGKMLSGSNSNTGYPTEETMTLDKALRKRHFSLLCAIIICGLSATLLAQDSFILSKNSDFSTDDRVFTRGDKMYMRVTASDVDFTNIKKNEFSLEPQGGKEEFEGPFTNFLNGTYEAEIDLSSASQGVTRWQWKGKIEDRSGRKFETRTTFQLVDGQQQTITVRGRISSIGAASIVVENTTVSIDAQTIFRDQNGSSISFNDLSVGDRVRVVAVRDATSGTTTASEINIEVRADSEVQVRGPIDAIGTDSLVVLGKTFFVDANTEVLDNDENSIALSTLQVGDVVEVRALVRPDSSFLASRIKIEDSAIDEVEFTGIISTISDSNIVVDGVDFVLTDSTEVLDLNDFAISADDLLTGERVEIRGDIGLDSVLRATHIKVEDFTLSSDEVEVTGRVTRVSSGSLTVAGLVFMVTDSTEVLDNNGQAVTFSAIEVGFVVEIRAEVVTSGTLQATRIKVEDAFNDEVDIVGVIEQIDGSTLTVSGLLFKVDSATVVLDDDGSVIDFQDLSTGSVVEIRANVQVDGTRIATRIKLEDDRNDEVELTGAIDAIGADSLVVSGMTFFVDGTTLITDGSGNVVQLSALSIGMLVEIKAGPLPDGRLVATDINIEDRIEDEIEITGSISAVSQTAITVVGRTFGVTVNTAVFDNSNNLINIGQLFVGQTVEVRGDLLPDGTLVAIKIKLESSGSTDIQISGPVEALTQNSVQVLGVQFTVDSGTQIFDERNAAVSFSALNVGQTLEIHAVDQGSVKLATRIKIEDVLLLSGAIQSVTQNGISLVQRQVLFDANTLILGPINKFLTIDDLQSGQVVEVRAILGPSSTIFGTKVRLLTGITAVETGPGDSAGPQPDNFVILQNYPNPFNPTTTIRFQVPSKAGHSVVRARVTIYNLLGQQVRVLVDENVSTGTVQVRRWDGKDDRGANVASGIFLYRLDAGSFVETRRMTLLR